MPGTLLTFFPWPDARRGARGTGEVAATAFVIPAASMGYWLDRLEVNHVTAERGPERFGQEVIRLADPDGMPLELIAAKPAAAVQAWADSPVPTEHSLCGFHSVSAALEGYERTANPVSRIGGVRHP